MRAPGPSGGREEADYLPLLLSGHPRLLSPSSALASARIAARSPPAIAAFTSATIAPALRGYSTVGLAARCPAPRRSRICTGRFASAAGVLVAGNLMLWSGGNYARVGVITGLVYAIVTQTWRLRQIYEVAYFPLAGTIWLLGALGQLPRVKPSTKGEGHERRYFYGSVWAVCIAQPILWLMWKVLPRTRGAEAIKLFIFVGILIWVGNMARRGLLPRTRPIVPGELAVSD